MTLDEIRQELTHRISNALIESRVADQNVTLAKAELEAHDRAVAAMPAVMNGETAKPKRAKRRNIPALVREALTDKPQGLKQLTRKTGVPAWRLRRVISRMRLDHEPIATSSDNNTFWCPP